ncbi:MAG: DUF2279 domain-containing protein [Saprospiraceae bacterium]
MKKILYTILFTMALLSYSFPIQSQYSTTNEDSLTTVTEPKFNKTRFYTALGIGGTIYTAGTYYLVQNWYKEYGLSKFHTFNDSGEWQYMDKLGHIFTCYNQSSVMYYGARWTGIKENNAIWFGIGMGMLLQTTIEVLDGFSPTWGFSIADMSANILGSALFFTEQKLWHEQKIILKVSSRKKNYPTSQVISSDGSAYSTLEKRANSLYGSTLPERILKDYNAQTYWISANMNSLFNTDIFPSWLNISLGYGTENMYGGFENTWKEENKTFILNNDYQRYKQFYLTPDIDFNRIKVKNDFLNGLFKALNIFKLPMPGIEITTQNKVILHWLVI